MQDVNRRVRIVDSRRNCPQRNLNQFFTGKIRIEHRGGFRFVSQATVQHFLQPRLILQFPVRVKNGQRFIAGKKFPNPEAQYRNPLKFCTQLHQTIEVDIFHITIPISMDRVLMQSL